MQQSGWWVGVGLVVCLLAGCQANTAAAPPASDAQAQALRQQLASSGTKAYVGLVIAVRPQDKFVAIGDVPVRDFHQGDAFVIVDSNQNVLAHGTVRAVTSDAVHLKYWVASGGRDPRVGDLGVRFGD